MIGGKARASPEYPAAMRHRRQAEFHQGDAFESNVIGVFLQALVVLACPVAVVQDRRVAIRTRREIIETGGDVEAEAVEMRLEMRQQIPGGMLERQQRAQGSDLAR